MKKIPFTLQDFQKHGVAETRDGREADFYEFDAGAYPSYQLGVLINGGVRRYLAGGKWSLGQDDANDLIYVIPKETQMELTDKENETLRNAVGVIFDKFSSLSRNDALTIITNAIRDKPNPYSHIQFGTGDAKVDEEAMRLFINKYPARGSTCSVTCLAGPCEGFYLVKDSQEIVAALQESQIKLMYRLDHAAAAGWVEPRSLPIKVFEFKDGSIGVYAKYNNPNCLYNDIKAGDGEKIVLETTLTIPGVGK